jgi:ribonuclease BN (tRNA processing enzyme)
MRDSEEDLMALVRFIGSGDAFGSGGRLQACILVEDGAWRCLLDCGASSLIGLKAAQVDPNSIDVILISHLHGDHFGGLPFFVLDAQFNSRRESPMLLVGHADLESRVRAAMEILFPGSEAVALPGIAEFVAVEPGPPRRAGSAMIEVFNVEHACGSPPFALRLTTPTGYVVGYTGDTAWTDALLEVAAGADLLVAEAYFFDKKIRWHLDYATLAAVRPTLGARRTVVTHLSADMLSRVDSLDMEVAHDGLVIEL